MALHVTARFVSRDDSRDELKKVLVPLVESVRGYQGCERCHLAQGAENPNEFLFLEEWKDEAAYEGHLAEEALKRAVSESEALLGEPAEVKLFERVV